MRKLFMAIMIPIMVVVGTPALFLGIVYEGSGYEDMPVHLYTEDADWEQLAYQELVDSLDDLTNGVNEDMEYNLHEDIINTAIYQQIKTGNPSYAPDDQCEETEAESCYIGTIELPIEEGSEARIVGAWVEFEQSKFILNAFADIRLTDGFNYRTVVEVHFNLYDTPGAGKYTLEFEKVKLGNLPIPATLLSSILTTVENNVDGLNLDSATEDVPIGTLDLATFTYTLEKQEIVDKIGESQEGTEADDGALMMQEIVSIIFEQGLLDFELVEEELVLSARLSKFKSEDVTSIPEYLYELHEVDGVDENGNPVYGAYDPNAFDPETYLANVFTEYVFNNALIGGGFEITDELFNKVIYSSAEGFEAQSVVNDLELPDGTIRQVEVGLKSVWFTIEEDAIYANALFKLDATMSLMKLKATKVEAESNSQQLVFDFTELSFGQDDGETAGEEYVSVTNLDVFETFLTDIEDIKFGAIEETANGVYLTITTDALTALLTEGSNEDTVIINSIELIHGAIVLEVEPADQDLAAALEDLNEAINTVLEDETLITNLETALNPDGTDEEAQDVIDAMNNIQDVLQDPEQEITTEDVETLFEEFEDLDSESQEQFLTEIGDLIDPSVLEDFANQFGEDVIPSTTTP
jgi:hypothetical protein